MITKALEFAQYVNVNKEELVEHCLKNSIEASNSEPLHLIVDKIKDINRSEEMYDVYWYDIDGTILKQMKVLNGTVVQHPENPNYDPENLTFMKWVSAYNTTTITHNTNFGAQYCIKNTINVNGTEVRPTIILFKATDNLLSPTINIYKPSTSTVYIDWDDGTIDTIEATDIGTYSSFPMNHTYDTAKDYYVKIYSTGEYEFRYSSSTYNFGSRDYDNRLFKVYLGDNCEIYTDFLNLCKNVEVLTLPITNNSLKGEGPFDSCNFGALIIPDNYTNIQATGMLTNAQGVKCIIFPHTIENWHSSSGPTSQTRSVIGLEMPESYKTFNLSVINSYSMKWIYLSPNCTKVNSNMNISGTKIKINYSQFTETTGYVNLSYATSNTQTELIFPEYVEVRAGSSSSGILSERNLEKVEINKLYDNTRLMISNYTITDLKLPVDLATDLEIRYMYNLTKKSFLGIMKNLKDLTNTTAKTLSINNLRFNQMENTYVDNECNEVDSTTEGAITLMQYVLNKNWTITINNY